MSEKSLFGARSDRAAGNLVRADVRAVCHASGVRPVQLEALHYLTQCNRYSDTPQAVA